MVSPKESKAFTMRRRWSVYPVHMAIDARMTTRLKDDVDGFQNGEGTGVFGLLADGFI